MDDVRTTTERYLAGELGPAEQAELARWLAEDEANRVAFLAEVGFIRTVRGTLIEEQRGLAEQAENDGSGGFDAQTLEALREIQAAAKDTPPITLEEALARYQPAVEMQAPDQERIRIGQVLALIPRRYLYRAAAALFILAATLVIVLQATNPTPKQTAQTPGTDEPQPARHYVATLSAAQDARWQSESPTIGDALYSGQRLTLTEGFAEITTRRGAVAIVEAPASFNFIDNDNALRLYQGKLVGLCHTPSSKGFVVKTNHADITDLGTEFGVTVQGDRVEAGVFVGEIAVNIDAQPSVVINKNQTALVKADVGAPALVVTDQLAEGYTRRLPRPALVQSARMIHGGDFQPVLAPQAFFESALLYTDRGYRALPSPGEELPDALLGGDIVMTPVDLVRNRSKTLIEVELTVQQPANVFVLRPPDARIDGWLERDYINTGSTVRIGAPRHGGRTCEVWLRKSQVSGTTTVAWGVTADAAGMYTLVVTPAVTE